AALPEASNRPARARPPPASSRPAETKIRSRRGGKSNRSGGARATSDFRMGTSVRRPRPPAVVADRLSPKRAARATLAPPLPALPALGRAALPAGPWGGDRRSAAGVLPGPAGLQPDRAISRSISGS